MTEYINMWKNFANFSGTANKRDYWMAFLFNFIVSFVLVLITSRSMINAIMEGRPAPFGIANIYALAAFIPSLSIAVRRLRDIGKEWFYIFLFFVPCVGWIFIIYLLAQPTGRYR